MEVGVWSWEIGGCAVRLCESLRSPRLCVCSGVAQTFLPAGCGDFPVAAPDTELESSVNPQVGKPALHGRRVLRTTF